MDKGIRVITFDADSKPEGRELFINQAKAVDLGAATVESVAQRLLRNGWGPDGERGETVNMAILSQFETDANLSAWRDAIIEYTATNYSWIKIDTNDIIYGGASETDVQNGADILISRLGEDTDNLQAILGITSIATPALGAAYDKAVISADPHALALGGIATPVALKDYILDESNPMESGVLWSCMDLGYLAVMSAYQLYTGEITPESTTIAANRLGDKTITNSEIILGDCLIFDASNVEQYNY